MTRCIAWLLAAGLAWAGGCDDTCDKDLAVWGARDGKLRFEACSTLAVTEAERMAGLTAKPIGQDEALILVFPTVGEVCIVNADVGHAIDIVFVGANETVLATETEVAAFSTVPRCHGGVQWVIETHANITAGTVAGDVVVLPN